MLRIKRALLSVSDKRDLPGFASFLKEQGVELLSTGGTLQALQKNSIPAISIAQYTGFPEILGGRVKTLHPKIHGGLLARRDLAADQEALRANGIESIDLLVANLYPFAQTISKPDVSLEEAIENIDIGGPAMLRAAAKNFEHTAVVCEPGDYDRLRQEIQSTGGIGRELRLELARKVFNHTAGYDSLIANYLNIQAAETFPENLTLSYQKIQALRYGENPHQQAAFYRPFIEVFREKQRGYAPWQQIQGKELSYNNMLDSHAALRMVAALPRLGVVIVKHLNPCGTAIIKDASSVQRDADDALCDAFLRARSCDPISTFGGIIAVQGKIGLKTALTINENFAEVILARAFSTEALALFARKKNLRLLVYTHPLHSNGMEPRSAMNGLLYQQTDTGMSAPEQWQIVSRKKADPGLLASMDFAWRICKQVKSNAIVFCSPDTTLGIGAGQMSRLDSVEIAISKARKAKLDLEGSIVASDAFFPFRDGIDALAQAGAKAVIQPGGSLRDKEVVAAADEHGIIMAFTGMRHFLH